METISETTTESREVFSAPEPSLGFQLDSMWVPEILASDFRKFWPVSKGPRRGRSVRVRGGCRFRPIVNTRSGLL